MDQRNNNSNPNDKDSQIQENISSSNPKNNVGIIKDTPKINNHHWKKYGYVVESMRIPRVNDDGTFDYLESDTTLIIRKKVGGTFGNFYENYMATFNLAPISPNMIQDYAHEILSKPEISEDTKEQMQRVTKICQEVPCIGGAEEDPKTARFLEDLAYLIPYQKNKPNSLITILPTELEVDSNSKTIKYNGKDIGKISTSSNHSNFIQTNKLNITKLEKRNKELAKEKTNLFWPWYWFRNREEKDRLIEENNSINKQTKENLNAIKQLKTCNNLLEKQGIYTDDKGEEVSTAKVISRLIAKAGCVLFAIVASVKLGIEIALGISEQNDQDKGNDNDQQDKKNLILNFKSKDSSVDTLKESLETFLSGNDDTNDNIDVDI